MDINSLTTKLQRQQEKLKEINTRISSLEKILNINTNIPIDKPLQKTTKSDKQNSKRKLFSNNTINKNESIIETKQDVKEIIQTETDKIYIKLDKSSFETKLFLNKIYNCYINDNSILEQVKLKLNKDIIIPKEFLRCYFIDIPDMRSSVDLFNEILSYCSKYNIKIKIQVYNYDEYRYNTKYSLPYSIYEYSNY